MSRSILSFAALFSIVLGIAAPGISQTSVRRGGSKKDILGEAESRKQPKTIKDEKKPLPQQSLPSRTVFGKVEVYSDGKGAWVRWRMESELKNAGFRVYRLDKSGEMPVSDFILGSYITNGDRLLLGAEYNYFDPKGTPESAYFVEAVDDKGVPMRTSYKVPESVESIHDVPGGTRVIEEAFAPKAGDNRVSQELNVTSELKAEIESGLLEPDPVRHREVISTPGGVRVTSKAGGLVRVSKTELQNGGFDVNSASANWQLYLEGVELPMIIGPNGDYIEFLGKAIDTLETDIRTYYLIPGASAGKRIANQVARPPLASVLSQRYSQVFVRADKKNYLSQVLNGSTDNWFGDVVTSGGFDYKFNLSGIDRTPGTRKVKVAFQGYSTTSHLIELTLNGNLLTPASGSGRNAFETEIDVPVAMLLDGENTFRMKSIASSGDFSFLSRLEIDFPRKHIAIGNTLEFQADNLRNTQLSGFSSSNVRVFDVTYENHPRQMTNLSVAQTNGTWGTVIPASRTRIIYAIENGAAGTALSVTPNDTALLEAPQNAGTFLVITHPSLLTQANAWAAYRAGQGVVTKVVDINEIYDEFSYGVVSSYAIEDFLEYAKNNWQTPPAYVLLIGDGHYDSKNVDASDIGYWNMIPARTVDTLYMETGSDEALSDFNDDGLAEIPIGRIAARSGASVTNVLNKTIVWEAGLNANSMNRGVLFAHDWPDGYDFQAMSNRLMSNLPGGVPKLSISQTSPTGQADIIAATNETDGGTTQNPGANAGQYLLNYTGHGAVGVWRNTAFFSFQQAPLLTNANYPSLMVSLSCLNGYFMTTFDSFAEAMTNAGNGGAVMVWASTGETTPDVQEIMGTRFYTKLGDGSIPRIGDLINDAKAVVPAGADVRLSWALLGDPMLKVR